MVLLMITAASDTSGSRTIELSFRYARRCFGFIAADVRFAGLVKWLAPFHKDQSWPIQLRSFLLDTPELAKCAFRANSIA
jgi:hypothetical protein